MATGCWSPGRPRHGSLPPSPWIPKELQSNPSLKFEVWPWLYHRSYPCRSPLREEIRWFFTSKKLSDDHWTINPRYPHMENQWGEDMLHSRCIGWLCQKFGSRHGCTEDQVSEPAGSRPWEVAGQTDMLRANTHNFIFWTVDTWELTMARIVQFFTHKPIPDLALQRCCAKKTHCQSGCTLEAWVYQWDYNWLGAIYGYQC